MATGRSINAKTTCSAPYWTRSCCTCHAADRLPRRLWPIVQSQAQCATGVWREPFDDRLPSFLARTTYQVSSVSGSTSVLAAVSASDNLPMMLGSGW